MNESSKEEGQVSLAVNRCHGVNDKLAQAVENLEVRLSSVLINTCPAPPEGSCEKVTREVVPLAGEIGAISGATASQTDRIESILSRLEL